MGRPKNVTRVDTLPKLVALGRADLISFSRWPLGYEDQYSLWDCQKAWQEEAQWAYKARLADPIDGRHLNILAPSEHGKTYGLDIPFILWALARNRNLRIGVVGSKDDLAANIGHGIDRLFKTRKADLELFGLIPGSPWNAYEKFLVRDDDKLLHPSIMFLGPDTELQGVRFDIIFLTDLATFKNQRTPESRRKMLDWMFNTLFPRLEPWGFVMAEGHHVDPEDLYTEFGNLEEDWRQIKYKAIVEEPTESNGAIAKILAPEHWTYKQLARIRSRAPQTFQLIYQNVPVAREGIVARAIFERNFDLGRSWQYHTSAEIKSAYKEIVIGVDPAFTIKRHSSYSACLIWGIKHDGEGKDLLGGWRDKMLSPQLRDKIISTILCWEPTDCFIESNAAQVFFVSEVQKKLGKLASIVKPVFSSGNDPETSVEHLMGKAVQLAQAGLVTFPYMDAGAQSMVEQLILEITNFPNSRTRDVAMAWNILENGLANRTSVNRTTIKIKGGFGFNRRVWRIKR